MYENKLKRLFDFIISLLALIIISPILFLLFVLVKYESSGPFIFAQERVGKELKIFTIFKIRTMTEDASKDANDKNTQYITTRVGDSRITRVGKILRKYHLDEIPQFLNVLKGEMSIIGVRPDHISQEKDYHPDLWVKRNSLKPGITGLSQIKSNKFSSNLRSRDVYDIFYINNKKKFQLDLYIFLMTLKKIFKGGSF